MFVLKKNLARFVTENHTNEYILSFSRYETVDRLHQEVTSIYRDSEIDWIQVYNAGCTIDDTVLPEHVTEPNDLDRLINGTFRLFLAALPTPPTIVTIARYESNFVNTSDSNKSK